MLAYLKKNNERIFSIQKKIYCGIYFKSIRCAIFIFMILFSCSQNPSSWYPLGSATIVSYYETIEEDETRLTATIEVHNKGITNIHSCSVSLAASTDIRTYRQTIFKSVDILPGGRIYEDCLIAYNKPTERLKSDGLAVINEFYY